MTEQDAQFKQAVAAFKAGNKDEARNLLMDVVDKDEQHEQAWLYLSALVTSLEEQQICLENVLAINPNNDRAKKGLEKVLQKLVDRDADTKLSDAGAPASSESAPAQTSQPDTSSPFSSLDWDSIPAPSDPTLNGDSTPTGAADAQSGALGGFSSFEGLGVEGSVQDESSAWFDSGAAAPGADDPFAASSSVDWSNPAAPAAYGSGEQVDLPSGQEYDEWVQSLNLSNGDEPAVSENFSDLAVGGADDPFSAGDARPFGETGYLIGDDALGTGGEDSAALFGAGAAGAGESAWEPGLPGADFGAPAASEDAFSGFEAPTPAAPAPQLDPFGRGSLLDDSIGDADLNEVYEPVIDYEPDFYGDDDLSDLDFSFDDSQDLPEEAPRAERRNKRAAKRAAAVPAEHAKYYAMIPADIQARGGGSRTGVLLLGVIVMLALNAASFAMLLM